MKSKIQEYKEEFTEQIQKEKKIKQEINRLKKLCKDFDKEKIKTLEGRKNGKTTELAGVNNFMLVGDGEGPFIFCINLILFLLYFLFIFL